MRIGLDVSSLSSPHQYRGLGFYTQRLLKALSKDSSALKVIQFSQNLPKKVDLIHYPSFTLFSKTPQKTSTPTVITVHDLIPLKFPKHYPLGLKGRFFWLKQKKFLQSVSAIITDSQSSKKDIHQLTNISLDQISVVYLAADRVFTPNIDKVKLKQTKKKYQLPDKFVLYVGDLNWNKNIPFLTQSCLDLNYPLVVVGRQATNTTFNKNHPENQDMVEFFRLANNYPKKIIRLGFIPTKDLVCLYNLATVYAQPSIAEGFGLPVLEAFASGCPVVTSNSTSLTEIAGKAALLIDPHKPLELETAIKKLFNQPTLRSKLSKLGLIQSNKFSWQKTAKNTLKVYAKTLKNN